MNVRSTISVSVMRLVNDGVMAEVRGEWIGVARLGEDELLTELPSDGDIVEVGTERMRVEG